jgi:DNA polymerase
MVVGGAPSVNAARTARRFAMRQGKLTAAGRLLENALREALSHSLDEVYVTDLVKAVPPKAGGGLPAAIVKACRVHLEREFAAVRPALVVALGNEVAHALIPGFKRVGLDRGKPFMQIDGTYVIATFHPSYAVRFGRERQFREDIARGARLMAANLGG